MGIVKNCFARDTFPEALEKKIGKMGKRLKIQVTGIYRVFPN